MAKKSSDKTKKAKNTTATLVKAKSDLEVGIPAKLPKSLGGRPTKMDSMALKKLEEVFMIGGTDEEACFYANISHQTLYNYQRAHPEFIERKEALKQRPVLKARTTVVASLDDPIIAFKYLEKKKKDEFGNEISFNLNETVILDEREDKLNKLIDYVKAEAKTIDTD